MIWRLDVRRHSNLEDDAVAGRYRVRVKVVKNKAKTVFRVAEFDMIFGSGISREGGLISTASSALHRARLGAWYSYHGEQLGRARKTLAASFATIPTWLTKSRKRSRKSWNRGGP